MAELRMVGYEYFGWGEHSEGDNSSIVMSRGNVHEGDLTEVFPDGTDCLLHSWKDEVVLEWKDRKGNACRQYKNARAEGCPENLK